MATHLILGGGNDRRRHAGQRNLRAAVRGPGATALSDLESAVLRRINR